MVLIGAHWTSFKNYQEVLGGSNNREEIGSRRAGEGAELGCARSGSALLGANI